MDNSFAESDMSLSPSGILERLQVLRQLQLLQRCKLQKQQLQYEDFQKESGSATEIVSHFTNSTSYNTFRSLLNESESDPNEFYQTNFPKKVNEQDLIEGISVLHLSQESEFIITSPGSSNSQSTLPSRIYTENSPKNVQHSNPKKQIALDEMPILSPKKDFEILIKEKLQAEKQKELNTKVNTENIKINKNIQKKPFLKRGACMARFGLKKNDLVIQNTKSLPWVKRSEKKPNSKGNNQDETKEWKSVKDNKSSVEQHHVKFCNNSEKNNDKVSYSNETIRQPEIKDTQSILPNSEPNSLKESVVPTHSCIFSDKKNVNLLDKLGKREPASKHKSKTWAAILTKEQDDFLRELKQSDYYKNFESPAKSTISDLSCDENYVKMRLERESAEQNMFNLLESKTHQQSFDINSSFIHKFLRRNKLENSGNNTPLVMQKCLKENPKLLHINPAPETNTPEISQTKSVIEDICDSEYTDCDESSTCCSCNTVEEQQQIDHEKPITGNRERNKSDPWRNKNKNVEVKSQNITIEDNTKANMEDMNAKLVATSELLKERLKELEDEIEAFRKENAKLAQMKEEIDFERQKFYEEKSACEQKLNEDKILAEYYLAEEKEKLSKQKQTYERYIREMRGRLNKKEKVEVMNLKKEISDLKEEIRLKDAKSTSSIARLRNQIKILEKERKELEEELEKSKKENKRIQHSNEVTRRLSNLKYLEEINRKLTTMTQSQSDINTDKDVKYKAFEIERQSRSRKKKEVLPNKNVHKRAKSVPNLNVTSCYAKYFSQRDVISQVDRNNTVHVEPLETCSRTSDNDALDSDVEDCDDDTPQSISDSQKMTNSYDISNDNNLERIYMERFQTASPPSIASTRFNAGDASSRITVFENTNDFFLKKSSKITTDNTKSISPLNRNIQNSPSTCFSNKNPSTSPKTILTNKSPTIEEELDITNDSQKSQELTHRKSVNKTNMNPIENHKPDGARELRFPNGNVKLISADGTYNTKTYHMTHADGLEVLEFADGQVEKRYKDGSTEIRLPNGSIRYTDPKNEHVREEWRFPDGTVLTVASNGEQRVRFPNGQIEVHTKDHKRREFPDGTVKLVYNDGTSETRYSTGRIRVKDRRGNLIMDSASR
ncbi:Centromere protein J [Eumeta japonica]|uniref:Centromere protein J n=1 Tax=Eumeta variegata TaxID=151549 RepID=A0A4C1VLG2_EUMVA|nr:Centromere protein J [Eumeta japonica]